MLMAVGSAKAQNVSIEGTVTGAYVMPNNFNMPEYNRGSFGIEMAVWHRLVNDETWRRLRNWPSFGLKCSFLVIPDGTAGNRLGIVGIVKAPLWWRIDYSLGVGLSSFSRPYCLTHDPENIFISSWVNCLIDVGLRFNVTDRLSVETSFLHSSNGNMYRPNKGLNFLQVGVGYTLLQSGSNGLPIPVLNTDTLPSGFHEVGFTLSNGIVMSRHQLQQGYYPCYDLALNWLYYVGSLVAVGATADFWYNYSYTWMTYANHYRNILPVYVGLQGVCEGHWGPFSLRVGLGWIPLASQCVGVRVYERVGAYYNWRNNYVGVGLNARAGMIEFVEWGYGYRFPIRRK